MHGAVSDQCFLGVVIADVMRFLHSTHSLALACPSACTRTQVSPVAELTTNSTHCVCVGVVAHACAQVITPKTGEAFLKLRLKDQAAALKLLDDDLNLKGRLLWLAALTGVRSCDGTRLALQRRLSA